MAQNEQTTEEHSGVGVWCGVVWCGVPGVWTKDGTRGPPQSGSVVVLAGVRGR